MKSFTDFYIKDPVILEKQILLNNSAKYNQVVFLAGGSGSGKGFARKYFLESSKFKIHDVDDLKMAFMELDKLGKFTTSQLIKKYAVDITRDEKAILDKALIKPRRTLKDLVLKNPDDVNALHLAIKLTNTKNKILDNMLQTAKGGVLPNLMLDTTFKDTDEMERVIPQLMEIGYKSQNIHLVWVLTDYKIAILNNAKRARVVPRDVLFNTHKGAARTVHKLLTQGLPREVDGSVYVILNNKENTIFYLTPDGKPYKTKSGHFVVKDFKYIKVKSSGKKVDLELEMKEKLLSWIKDNVPKDTLNTRQLDRITNM